MSLLVALAAAAAFEISAGAATENTVRIHDSDWRAPVAELSWRPRGWDLSVGRIGEQDNWDVGAFQYVSAQKLAIAGPLELGAGVLFRTHARNIDELLPSAINFSLSAGLTFGGFRVEFRHASNAGLESPNRGQNWILAGWQFGGTGE